MLLGNKCVEREREREREKRRGMSEDSGCKHSIELLLSWTKCAVCKLHEMFRCKKPLFINGFKHSRQSEQQWISGTYSIPEIIFSYSSHQGTWFSFFAFSISCMFFSWAAILSCTLVFGGTV